MKNFFIITLLSIFLCNGVFSQSLEQLAPTPPMGWNSWNKFGCNVSEKLIKSMADVMVSSGMKDAGYEYIVIDDCWQIGRDKDGNILIDEERFPSGMKELGDYIHSKGLKFGIYSCAGSLTCQGRPGSRGYQFQDARQYAAWGVDYLKYDWCSNEEQNAKAAYSTMRDAIAASGRPIVYSICEWGENKPWEWGKGVGNLWRTTPDIRDCFDCLLDWGGVGVLQILDKQVGLENYAGPGHWNDPDMLEVGNGGMSTIEYKTHFSLWCMLAAPLMAGNDLSTMSIETKEILTNKDLIAVNQDALGIQGYKFMDFTDMEIWVKPLSNGEAAFCFLNRSNSVYKLNYDWKKFGMYHESLAKSSFSLKKNEYDIIDLWSKANLGNTSKPLQTELKPHEALVVKLRVKRSLI